MISFQYKGVDNQGKRVSGSLQSDGQAAALSSLSARGYQVFELTQARGGKGNSDPAKSPSAGSFGASWRQLFGGKEKIAQAETLLSIDELATLLDAGVPLADAVENIARGYVGHPLGNALDSVYAGLRSGASFARALDQSSFDMPAYVYELVRAGEETGKLGQSLRSAAEQMEADAKFRREARNALTYPFLLIISGLVATLVVFVFVVPKFANILSNPKADLPLISQWVLQSGLWLVSNKLFATGIALAFVFSAVTLWLQPGTRTRLWEAASRAPVLGNWILHVELARWGGMLAVLLGNHVPLLEALGHSRNSLTGQQWRHKADLVLVDVRAGKSLADAMQSHHFVDAVGINLIRVGERSGALPKTVAALATMHRNSSEQSLKQFLVLLEPLTILMVSVLLGGIMISVMLAITSLTNVI
ncbi:type II secretion system F family protein [Variovorax sp. H27-G14]|uniref:type II secretion system F family protein n=1 Tax=Variovorax sp. H27-G14 TaxID=3111914 RepID=UPI0038FD2065